MSFKLILDDTRAILARRNLETGGKVQKVIDSEVLRYNRPYVPFLSGQYRRSGDTGTEIGSGKVIYNVPYARYHYYGKLMVGPMPKTLTNVDLKYHGGSLTGAKHFERMKIDHLKDILRAAEEVAGI